MKHNRPVERHDGATPAAIDHSTLHESHLAGINRRAHGRDRKALKVTPSVDCLTSLGSRRERA
jgi:hypothetical protein